MDIIDTVTENLCIYDELHSQQKQGIPEVYETVSNSGFVALEGECGTGKTALAVFALLQLIEDSDKYSRIAVVTDVKQQIPVFEEEIEQINSIDGNSYTALTLTGKPDVCPLVQNGNIAAEDIHHECERLRDNTRRIIKSGGDDAQKRAQIAARLQDNAELSGNAGDTYTSDGVIKYPFEMNQRSEQSGTEYCGYYAGYQESLIADAAKGINAKDIIPTKLQEGGVIRQHDLLKHGSEWGTCPHSVMGELIPQADVIIGNYRHLFDPQTTSHFTNELLDESTLCVIDEAHNLVRSTRDILSYDISLHELDRAINEVESLLHLLCPDTTKINDAWVEGTGVSGEDIIPDSTPESLKTELLPVLNEQAIGTNRFVTTWEEYVNLSQYIQKEFNKQNPSWKTDTSHNSMWSLPVLMKYYDFLRNLSETIEKLILDNASLTDNEDVEIDIDTPDDDSFDKLTTWLGFQDKGRFYMSASDEIGNVLGDVTALINEKSNQQLESRFEGLGLTLEKWVSASPVSYYKTLTVEPSGRSKNANYIGSEEIATNRNVQLSIKNCLPRDEIAEVLDSLGGGVLMSATLAPLDVFAETAGLRSDVLDDRPVNMLQYGLSFPQENRETLFVDSTPFTYSNKSQMATRQEYEDIIVDTVHSINGNVLICMPTYGEAEWAGDIVKEKTNVSQSDVYVDVSSSNAATSQLREDFFDSDGAVLVTGAHGTLIEGVDYKGDRLDGALVCGVPIENTSSDYSTAIQYSYSEVFGHNNGFTYAFTVPAVRKSRQAIGRVIRSADDVGVRILADGRYSRRCSGRNCVDDLLPDSLHSEAKTVSSDEISQYTRELWK